ncbi:MAG TPA: isoprenylcysteine carboxylmethyltransferase family protein [Burkholderiales bacterium]|nr:isoprenylcysteine carboxylmethyltransferase family protein [Burkholderiales bacterium]
MNPPVPPPVVAAIFGGVMWAVDRKLTAGQFESTKLTPIAVVLLIAGVTIMLAAAASLIAAKTTLNPLRPLRASSLITTGMFRISRNPIYLGDLLILTALAVWLGNVINVVVLGVFVWTINRFQIASEERALTKLFGERYVAYCSKVRRWL